MFLEVLEILGGGAYLEEQVIWGVVCPWGLYLVFETVKPLKTK
jgi:hypothetical protein